MVFKDTLLHIKDSLDGKSNTRNNLSKLYVAKRLNKSLMSYRSDLEFRVRYLNQRKPENVMKDM